MRFQRMDRKKTLRQMDRKDEGMSQSTIEKPNQYFEEASSLFGLSKQEEALAKLLMEGARPLDILREEGIEKELPLCFGHDKKSVYLYPAFRAYVRGELPEAYNGGLPEGMFLEFPPEEEIYMGKDFIEEAAEIFLAPSIDIEEEALGYVMIAEKGEGGHFLAGQIARSLAMPLLRWNLQRGSWKELLTVGVLYDALICIDLRGNQDCEAAQEVLMQLSKCLAHLLVLADKKEECLSGEMWLFREIQSADYKGKKQCLIDFEHRKKIILTERQRKLLLERGESYPLLRRMLDEFAGEARGARKRRGEAQDKEVQIAEDRGEQIISRFGGRDSSLFGMRRLSVGCSLENLHLPQEQQEKLRRICTMLGKREVVMKQWGFGQKYSYGNGITILL